MLAKNMNLHDLAVKLSYTTHDQLRDMVVKMDTQPTEMQLNEICEGLEVPVAFVQFYAIDMKDVQADKRALFRLLAPSIESLLEQIVKN